MFSYIHSPEDRLWTTGHRDERGEWHPECDCTTREYAAARVAWLNGGENPGTEREWQTRRLSPASANTGNLQSGIDWYRGQLHLGEKALENALAVNEGLATENANLIQENVELHELIAVQRAEIDALQRKCQRERMSAMQSAGAAALIRAIHSTRTRTHQTLVRVGGTACGGAA